MSVVEWFAIGTGSAAYLCLWRYFAGRIAWGEKGSASEPRTADMVWGVIVGAAIAPVGLVVVPYELLKERGTWGGLRAFMLRRGLYTPAKFRGDLR